MNPKIKNDKRYNKVPSIDTSKLSFLVANNESITDHYITIERTTTTNVKANKANNVVKRK